MSSRRLVRTGIAAVLAVVAMLGFAAPAHAVALVSYSRSCTVHNQKVNFTFTIFYWDPAAYYSVDRVKWKTPGFTPSRLVISHHAPGGKTPIIRAWGGSASTLHDVGSTGDTGSGWETDTHSIYSETGVYARVYLNADEWCDTNVIDTAIF